MNTKKLDHPEKNNRKIHPEYDKTKKKLASLFDNITIVESKIGFLETRYEIFKRNRPEMFKRWTDATMISETLKDMKTPAEVFERLPPPKSDSMNKMLVFLGLTESLGNTIADMVLMLLIVNGQEIHTRGMPFRHIKRFEDLTDLDMSSKTKILDDEELYIFKDILNTNIRNIVAHLKFRIDEKGVIRDNGNSPIEIDEAISNFWKGVYAIQMIFETIGFMKWLRNGSSKS